MANSLNRYKYFPDPACSLTMIVPHRRAFAALGVNDGTPARSNIA
jgi:hypothetical protein